MSAWSIPISKLAEKAQVDLSIVARKSTYELFRNVVLRSPVDTGRFRANWNFSVGNPDYKIIDDVDKQGSPKDDFKGAFGDDLVINRGRAATEVSKVLSADISGVMYLSNGLPYARRLEVGYSKKQAPGGMIRVTATEFRDYVQKAIA
jgi:hypothetical protein